MKSMALRTCEVVWLFTIRLQSLRLPPWQRLSSLSSRSPRGRIQVLSTDHQHHARETRMRRRRRAPTKSHNVPNGVQQVATIAVATAVRIVARPIGCAPGRAGQ